MYAMMLADAGYRRHGPETRNCTQCWIKDGAPDINVDNCTGLWADEGDAVGSTCATLERYLANQPVAA